MAAAGRDRAGRRRHSRATVRISADYVNSAKKTYVDTVATTSLRSATDLESVADAETYAQIGALVARAYVGHPAAATFDDEANKIDSELTGAKLVKVDEAPLARGPLPSSWPREPTARVRRPTPATPSR